MELYISTKLTFCEKEILGKCVLSWVIYGAKQRKTVNPCFDIELMKLRACMIILFRSQSMTTPTTHVGFRSLILEKNGVILPGGKHLQVLHQSPTHPQGLHLSDSWCGLDAPTSGGKTSLLFFSLILKPPNIRITTQGHTDKKNQGSHAWFTVEDNFKGILGFDFCLWYWF